MPKINTKTSDDTKSFHEQIDDLRTLTEQNLRYTKTIHQFLPKDAKKEKDEHKKVFNDILDYTKANYALLEKIHRWVIWQRIFGIIKIIILVVPIILGILFLPSLLEDILAPYQETLNQLRSG